MMKEKKKVHSH